MCNSSAVADETYLCAVGAEKDERGCWRAWCNASSCTRRSDHICISLCLGLRVVVQSALSALHLNMIHPLRCP